MTLLISSFLRGRLTAWLVLWAGCFGFASAQTYTTTISGVTTWNGFAASTFKTEFPVGTSWTAEVSWDISASALNSYPTEAQFRLLGFTLTLHGQSGDFVTSALADKASFGVRNISDSGGDRHNMSFTTEWGSANLTTGTAFGQELFNINITLEGYANNGLASLTNAPDLLNLGLYDLTNTNQTQLKIYLNNLGSSTLLGTISEPAVTPVPEPSTYAALAGLGALGIALWRRRARA